MPAPSSRRAACPHLKRVLPSRDALFGSPNIRCVRFFSQYQAWLPGKVSQAFLKVYDYPITRLNACFGLGSLPAGACAGRAGGEQLTGDGMMAVIGGRPRSALALARPGELCGCRMSLSTLGPSRRWALDEHWSCCWALVSCFVAGGCPRPWLWPALFWR